MCRPCDRHAHTDAEGEAEHLELADCRYHVAHYDLVAVERGFGEVGEEGTERVELRLDILVIKTTF